MAKQSQESRPELLQPEFHSLPRKRKDPGKIAARAATAVFIGLFLAAMIGFMILNFSARVDTLRLFWGEGHVYTDQPLILIVPVCVFAGILFSAVLGIAATAKHSFQNRRLRKQLKKMETEVAELKALAPPVAPERMNVLDARPASHREE